MKRFFICFLSLFVVYTSGDYIYSTKYIDVPVDHFSFSNNDSFKLRYLVNDTFWKPKGPIFFYTGNEGAIDFFAQNTGFMWEIAPSFNALIIFAEHRYYGDSLPYGNSSFIDRKHWGYLTSNQALADYVYLITDLQNGLKTKNRGHICPLIAFGGSYGGMLAAWMRLKYPGAVYAAIAASAPIFQFSGLTDCSKFNEILASVYSSSYNSSCVKNIKQSWKEIRDITSTNDGKTWLSNTLKVCKPFATSDDVVDFVDWLTDVYADLAMANYPYPTNFVAPLPAYPVRAFCSSLGKEASGKTLLQNLAKALSVYTNYTGQTKCLNFSSSTPNIPETVWDYQSCSELIMPFCAKDNAMFEESSWNFTEFSNECFKGHGYRPLREDLPVMEYGGKNALYTNIIFTNGLLDPWSGAGFLISTKSAYAIILPNAAHHLDLRASNPADPQSVINARSQIRDILHSWIKKF